MIALALAGTAMSPELKFHSITISATTAIVFLGWVCFNRFIVRYPVPSVVISGLISLGSYRFLAILFLSLFRRSKAIKRFILGPRYMQGTWAGFFVGQKQTIRLFVEFFEQELDRTVIRGRSYGEDGSFHGSWIAEDASVDPTRGKLTYHYQTDAIGNSFINPGIAAFDMQRVSANKPPEGLIGFSSDLYSPRKLLAFEEKIAEDNLLDCTAGFEKAQQVYGKNKAHITTSGQQPG